MEVRPVEGLFELVQDASVVLLGEASHGTREFYEVRAELTKRLVAERGFKGVAWEADWPAAARVNHYAQRVSDDEDAVVEQLREMRDRAAELARRDGRVPRDAHFLAEQNARLVKNAERYYRSMFRGRASSWNLRDTHMADTLDALRGHLDGGGIVVWAHNSHLGDARFTSTGRHGELNLGQLARERHGDDVVRIVGLTTHTGTVTAARDWDGRGERRDVVPSLAGSVERRLHEAGIRRGVIDLRQGHLDETLLQRMIGVVYRPETEGWSHYVEANARRQFDVLVHVDETTALEECRQPVSS